MKEHRIVNRGDGPRIEGTRITVYNIFEYVQKGHSREGIASELDLSSRQVQAALDYIRQHDADVKVQYGRIMDRIRKGNPTWVQERLERSRSELRARLEQHATGVERRAGDHVGQ